MIPPIKKFLINSQLNTTCPLCNSKLATIKNTLHSCLNCKNFQAKLYEFKDKLDLIFYHTLNKNISLIISLQTSKHFNVLNANVFDKYTNNSFKINLNTIPNINDINIILDNYQILSKFS